MSGSIWDAKLGEFRDQVSAPQAMPAAVSVGCATASLGLALLIKVLQITARRKNPPDVHDLLEDARRESAKLAAFADQDIAAYDSGHPAEVPEKAAHSAAAALDICRRAAPLISGPMTADVAASIALVQASYQAISGCINST